MKKEKTAKRCVLMRRLSDVLVKGAFLSAFNQIIIQDRSYFFN